MLEGSGHGPHARDPVKVNLLLRDFIVPPPPPRALGARGRAAPQARALRLLADRARPRAARRGDRRRAAQAASRPRDRLARAAPGHRGAGGARRAHPPGERAAGQRVAATSSRESAEHDLHAFQAIRRMDEILLANFMVFHDVVREDAYDLWIGDEAWELDYYLHENPEQKRAAYAWLTDFVGWLPMADGGEREAFLTADYNAEMIEHIARYPRVRDRAVFVGDADDVVPDALRPRAAGDPRLDRAALRLRRLRHRLRPGASSPTASGCGPSSATAPTSRSASSRSAARASAARLLRRVIEAFPAARGARAGPADDRRRRAAHRPGVAARARRARGARLRARPLPPPRRLRPRGRAGRADDLDGADREPAAVPLLPAAPPLRAELPRRATGSSATAPAGGWTSRPRRPR